MIDGTDNCKVIKLLFSFSAWNSASNLASKKGLSIFFVLLRGMYHTEIKVTINYTFKLVRVVFFLNPAAISATSIILLFLNCKTRSKYYYGEFLMRIVAATSCISNV